MALAAARYAFLLAVVVAGCATPAPEPDSGIEGVVLVGPTCPVERDPPDPACADRPYSGHFAVTVASTGRRVADFRSGEDGSFRVAVAPGTYVIRSSESSLTPPTCAPTEPVTVRAGEFTEVTVSCDSGIR